MNDGYYGAMCPRCDRRHCICPPKNRTIAEQEREVVEFRGKRWLVADARFDESPLEDGAGSHWHLTLTGPLERVRPKVAFLHSGAGDWVGLYVNGKLVDEGHSIEEAEVARALVGKENVTVVHGTEYLEENGGVCPESWDDVLHDGS